MYKIIECDQRSPTWFEARKGKWTGSFYDRAITPTGKRSSSAEEVNNRLVAELIAGVQDDTFQSDAMLRGVELEDEALEFINFTHGFDFRKVGFIDSGLGYGVSADGFNVDQEVPGLEMKIPSLHTHLSYLAGGCLPKKYIPQVQGAMLVTGAKKWAFMSYHPEVKPLVVIVERDEKFIESMREILIECCKEVKQKHEHIIEILEQEIA